MAPCHLNIGVANARLTYLSYDHPIDTKVKVRNIGNRHRRLVKFDEECMLLTLTRPVDGWPHALIPILPTNVVRASVHVLAIYSYIKSCNVG